MAEEARRTGGGVQRLVLWLLIAGLLVMVWSLASERNERHFKVALENGNVVVERGRYFPMGTSPSTDKIYAPLPLPPGEKSFAEMEFDDQNSLDQYLFGVLSGWAKDANKKGDTHAASALVDRASQLPGLTGAQVNELSALRASLAWDEAHAEVLQAADLLDGAARKLKLVETANGAHATEAATERTSLLDTANALRGQKKAPAPQAATPAK